MTNWGICQFFLFLETCLLFLTLSGAEATVRSHKSFRHARREHISIESRYQYSTMNHQVLQAQLQTVTWRPQMRKPLKLNQVEDGNTGTRIQPGKVAIDLTG